MPQSDHRCLDNATGPAPYFGRRKGPVTLCMDESLRAAARRRRRGFPSLPGMALRTRASPVWRRKCRDSLTRASLSGLHRRRADARAWRSAGYFVAHVISPQALSELVGSIYDCTLDPSRWDHTLLDIRNALDSRTVTLSLSDLPRNRVLINKSVGMTARYLELASEHAAEVNAVLSEALASLPSLDEPHLISRHLSAAYIETSRYIQEAVHPNGFADMMTFFLMHDATSFSGFGAIITDREIELGKLLLPHLRRAVTISKVLDARTIEGVRMAETLDALRCAVVLTNEDGVILHANSAAEHMLRDGSCVRSAKGVLQASLSSAASELRTALGLAVRDEAGIGKTGLSIPLTGPDSGQPPVLAHVLPLAGSDVRTRLQPAAVAAVFISAPVDAQDGAGMVAAAFGLTPAETRVLANLLAGHTLAETAAALGVTRYTANTHLDHIFMKTGVTRQAELMRLGMGLISPAGTKK